MPTTSNTAISCPLLTISDVMELTGYKRGTAQKIVKQLRDELIEQGKIVSRPGTIPAEYYLERTVGCVKKGGAQSAKAKR